MSQAEIVDIPTNVITGFLGAGKSTAILHLLKHKPAHERWAVLVNEFGEVGIDGELLGGNNRAEQGVFVREVAGGCMCCASGFPMQIALTSLLSEARPDRLLIEPTGLGHPKEVLAVLTADHYQSMLDLRATITLVDARKIREPRYAEHPTFLQQLAVADTIVANKIDRYDDQCIPDLVDFLGQTEGLQEKPLHQVEQGAIELAWLAAPTGEHTQHYQDHHDAHAASALPPAPEIPESGLLRVDNEGDGFFSQGWIFSPAWCFDEDKLDTLLMGIEADRLKAVFITHNSVTTYNMADGVMTKSEVPDSPDSRVEIISANRTQSSDLEEALLRCVASRTRTV